MTNETKALSEQLLGGETDRSMQIFNRMEAFLDLLQKAEPVGYLVISTQELSAGWAWTHERVENFLKQLKKLQWIQLQKEQGVATIVFQKRKRHYAKAICS